MHHRRSCRTQLERVCLIPLVFAAVGSASGAAAAQEDYVRRYAEQGPPPTEPVAEFADHTSFPPRLAAEPSDERFDIQPTALDVDDRALEAARQAVLADPRVREAIGERFVEIAIGADVAAKVDEATATDVTIGIEFFSYQHLGAVRAGVVGREVVFVERLDPGYQPPETAVEIERAVELIAADERRAELIRDAAAEGILTPCEASVRCLYVQFVRDGLITFSAVVDLINEQVFDEVENPDETPDEGEGLAISEPAMRRSEPC